MLTYVVAFLSALLVAAVLTPLVARFAYRHDLLDRPGEARKIHVRAVPRLGGIAVAAAFFAPIAGLAVYVNDISWLIYRDGRLVTALSAGATAILALGIWDDVRGAGAKLKLTVQALVAIGLWFAGFRIELLGNPLGEALELGMFSLPLTMLWIVGVVNAVNLIDGLDGLAAGIALFAAAVLFGVSFFDGAVLLCVFATALAGAVVGFLFFNFNPARIFLGDSGSMFLGFILAAISIWTQRKGATAVALLIPVIALGVPILDTTLSFVRRIHKRQNPFRADREHVHHRLLALGLTHRGAVLTLYTTSAVFALGALALLDTDATRRAIALSTVVAVVLILVRKVGFLRGPRRGHAQGRSSRVRDEGRRVARRIRGAGNLDSAWGELETVLPSLGCLEVRLLVQDPGHPGRGTIFRWRAEGPAGDCAFTLDGPIGSSKPIKRLRLEEGGQSFGELIALLDEKAMRHGEAVDQELALELLSEALVDHCVERLAREAETARRVVRLPRSREVSSAGRA